MLKSNLFLQSSCHCLCFVGIFSNPVKVGDKVIGAVIWQIVNVRNKPLFGRRASQLEQDASSQRRFQHATFNMLASAGACIRMI